MAVSLVRVLSGKPGGEPFSLGKVVRNGVVWVPRSQFCTHLAKDNDRALKARLKESEESPATEEEYAELKSLGAVNKHMAATKCLLVDARAAARAARKFLPQAQTRWVDMALARLL
jgi:hypothetical protein